MSWLVSGISLLATVLNIRRIRVCFLLWLGTNLAWAYCDLAHGLYARAPLDAAYAGLALWGWYAWGKQRE